MAAASPPLLTVYTFDSDHALYGFSPFATKLHLRLRHAGIPYVPGNGKRSDAPKGKIPYVRFESSGELMGDTALITARLVRDGTLPDLASTASPEARAVDLAVRAMVEDRMYFLLIYERWYGNYALMRDHGPFSSRSPVPRAIICRLIYPFVGAMLWFQGAGRMSRDEVAGFRAEAVAALAALADKALQRRKEALQVAAGNGVADAEAAKGHDVANPDAEPFWILAGDEPTEADFSVFGFLAGVVYTLP